MSGHPGLEKRRAAFCERGSLPGRSAKTFYDPYHASARGFPFASLKQHAAQEPTAEAVGVRAETTQRHGFVAGSNWIPAVYTARRERFDGFRDSTRRDRRSRLYVKCPAIAYFPESCRI
jgi:hypothetical protein